MKTEKKLLSDFLFHHKAWLALTTILLVVLGFFRMLGAKYIENITDIIASGILDGLWFFIGISALSQFLFYFFRWVVAVICQHLTQKLLLDIRLKLLNHLMRIPFLTFEKQDIGNLQSVLRNDAEDAADILYAVFSRILTNTFMVLFSWGYMCMLDPATGIVVLIAGVGMGFLNSIINRPLKKQELLFRQHRGKLSETGLQAYEGLEPIKTMNGGPKVLSRFAQQRDLYNQTSMKIAEIRGWREVLFTFLNNAVLFGGVIYFGFQAIAGISSIGRVMVFMSLLIQVLTPIGIIFRWVTSLMAITAAWERVYQVLDIPAEEPAPRIEGKDIRTIGIKGITFSYDGKRDILNSFGLDLEKGKLYNISGESGSGKSTLMKVLLGLYSCPGMQVHINGSKTEKANLSGLCAYVPPEPQLFEMSIYHNLSMGDPNITRQGCEQLAQRLGLTDWIRSLPEGWDTVIQENEKNLSGGQGQLIAVMRACLSPSPVLILDEPFSALDTEKETLLVDALDKLKEEKIILFTSHRQTTLSNVDKVYTINAVSN